MLLIANADAGSADGLDEAMDVLGCPSCTTTSTDDLDEVVHRDRFLVVAGGDGSLHAVVAALHRNDLLDDTKLALIPLGTGNDFARGAGIPLEPREAAELALHGEPTAVDVLLDDAGGVVVNNVHVGVGAEASRRAGSWKRRLGPVGYPIAAVSAALNPPALRLRVTVDGEVVSDRATLQVAIGNAPYVGGGTELTPRADPADGRVNVLVSFAVGPLARVAYAVRLRRGEHHRGGDVLYRRATSVTIEGDAFQVSADGEIQGPLTRRTWSLRRGALTMVLGPTG